MNGEKEKKRAIIIWIPEAEYYTINDQTATSRIRFMWSQVPGTCLTLSWFLHSYMEILLLTCNEYSFINRLDNANNFRFCKNKSIFKSTKSDMIKIWLTVDMYWVSTFGSFKHALSRCKAYMSFLDRLLLVLNAPGDDRLSVENIEFYWFYL